LPASCNNFAGKHTLAPPTNRQTSTIEPSISNDHRLGFLVIESEPARGLSTRKLLLESAKHVVAIDAGFGDAEWTALVRHIKAVNQKIRVVAFTPNVAAHSPWADETVSSHDPAELLRLLQEMGGRTDIA